MNKKLFFIPFIFLFVLLISRTILLLPPENSQLANGTRIEWTSCWFDIPFLKIIHCARLYPSLQNSGNSISIPVVVIKNMGFSQNPDPVIYINGGPGNSVGIDTHSNVSYWINEFDSLGWNRDFIIYDHRGTGLSYPQPQCKELLDIHYKNLPRNISENDYYHELIEQTKICYQNLAPSVSMSNFSTQHYMQDLRDLIDSLNYPTVNLYSVSYGTRVALELMRRSPEKLRSVILDSPFPSSINDVLSWPAILDNTVQNIFKRCRNNEVCHKKYPNLKELFTKALKQLKNEPMLVHLPEYYSDGHYDVFINDDRFVFSLFTAMYDSEITASLPDVINEVAQGKQKLMRPVITFYADMFLDSTMNDMVYNFVLCNDNGDITKDELDKEINKYPLLKYYNRFEWEYMPCNLLKEDSKLRLSSRPVKSSIPTLILSGEHDTVTPWQWGEQINKHLDNSFHFIVKDISHGVIGFDECALETSNSFLEELGELSKQNCSTYITPL